MAAAPFCPEVKNGFPFSTFNIQPSEEGLFLLQDFPRKQPGRGLYSTFSWGPFSSPVCPFSVTQHWRQPLPKLPRCSTGWHLLTVGRHLQCTCTRFRVRGLLATNNNSSSFLFLKPYYKSKSNVRKPLWKLGPLTAGLTYLDKHSENDKPRQN